MLEYYVKRCKLLEQFNDKALEQISQAKQELREGKLFDAMDSMNIVMSKIGSTRFHIEAIMGNLGTDDEKYKDLRIFIIDELAKYMCDFDEDTYYYYENLNDCTDFELLTLYIRKKKGDDNLNTLDFIKSI